MMSDTQDGTAADTGSVRIGKVGSLRFALAQLIGASVLIAGLEIPLLRGTLPDLYWYLATEALIGVVYVVVGAIAWDRRPSNLMGAMMCLAGFATLFARLSTVADPVLASLGAAVAQVPIAAALHLMLIFPSGRLQGGLDRVLLILGYIVIIAPQIALTLYRPADPSGAWQIADRPGVIAWATMIQAVTGALVLLAAAVLLVHRLRKSRAVLGERKARAAVYLYGIFSILFLPFSAQFLQPALNLSPIVLFLLQIGCLVGVPLAFAAGLLLGGFARTGQIEELGAWLGSTAAGRIPLRDVLADVLGDDSLQLLFRRQGAQSLLDPAGRLVPEPIAQQQVGAVEVEVRGRPSALIVYDTSLVADPALVASAGRVVGLALERERLTAELIAEREALRESRSRLVEVGDLERRRFARDLHDLLQSRLLLAAVYAGSLAAAPGVDPALEAAAERLRVELEAAIAELRRLVHGLLPALLVERGLAAAAEDLFERSPIPVTVEIRDVDDELGVSISTAAYFILAEACANAIKHSYASAIHARLEVDGGRLLIQLQDNGIGGADGAGSGLRGLADRVDAMNGTMALRSEPGQGTTLTVRLPIRPFADAGAM